MGRNYSFEVILEVSAVDDVLFGLGAVLIEEDRQRIHRSLPWQPEHIIHAWVPTENRHFEVQCGIKNVRDPDHEKSEGRYCFSLHVPLSGNLRHLSRKHIPSVQIQDRRQAYIDIGCVWTEIRIGREWGLLMLTAVGTGVSLLFHESIEIQQTLSHALEPCARAVLLYDYEGWEDEAKEVTILHPRRDKVAPWDRRQARVVCDYSFEGQVQYRMDLGLDPDRYAALVWDRLGNCQSLKQS